jgi:hypothetical protein
MMNDAQNMLIDVIASVASVWIRASIVVAETINGHVYWQISAKLVDSFEIVYADVWVMA